MTAQIKTGIQGLDAMLYGGIPEKNQVLLAGGPGAGKSLLGMEYLYRNALMGNNGILFSLEEDAASVMGNFKSAFPDLTDVDKLVKQKKMAINAEAVSSLYGDADSPSYNFGKLVSDIDTEIAAYGANRVVIDSVSLIDVLIKDKIAYRRAVLEMIKDLKRLQVTSLLITQLNHPDRAKLVFKPEYFMFDGIMIMYQTGEEQKRMPAIEIIKMRGSKHSFVTTPYDITPAGFRILAAEDITAAYS